MMHRVGKCFGLPLWKSAQRYVELWFCFSAVQPHSHPGQNVEIVPLFGWATFFRIPAIGHDMSNPCAKSQSHTECVRITPRRWFRAFSIPAGWVHWFTGTPLVFLNISDTSQSAAVNFQSAIEA